MENHFTVTARQLDVEPPLGDVLSLDNSKLFFVTGGTDCLLRVWNINNGHKKHTVALPCNQLKNIKVQTETTSHRRRLTQIKKPNDRHIFKHIVGLLFHPIYQNLVFVMQEGGDVHGVDAQIGEIIAESVAVVPSNSSWALDEENLRVLVCGDLG